MVHLHLFFWIFVLLRAQMTGAKPFGSFSTNRRNAPTNLLASVSFEMDDIDELLVAPVSSTAKSKSFRFDLSDFAESIVKAVAAVLFAKCFYALTAKRKQTDNSTANDNEEESNTFPTSSTSSVPPLSATADWKEIIERVNYLQATLHDYFDLWGRQMNEHDSGMNTGWVTCMEVSEQNAHVIHELNEKLEDLRNQVQGMGVSQVSEEETTVETVTTVESETPLSEELEE
jgi:hypothetical protein